MDSPPPPLASAAPQISPPRGRFPLWIYWVVLVVLVALRTHVTLQRTSFYDDAFIYLHTAANVVERGTARYFIPANNPGLLTSSPLKLLLLVPATWIAEHVYAARTLDCARLTLLLALLFSPLPFALVVRRWRDWFFLATGGLVISFASLSAELMESTLVWCCSIALACLLQALHAGARDARQRQGLSWRLGLLLALCCMTRPEYGIAASVTVMALFCIDRKQRPALGAFVIGLLLPVLAWIAIAAMLKVYFIPTTYLAKILTGKLNLFSEQFWVFLPSSFFGRFFILILLPFWEDITQLNFASAFWPMFIGLLAFGMTRKGPTWMKVRWVELLVLCGLLLHAPGVAWYYDSFFVWLVSLCAVALYFSLRPIPREPRIVFGGLIFLYAVMGFNDAKRTPWDFGRESARGTQYYEMAKQHRGDGIFETADGVRHTYYAREIGIVAYFAGNTVWLGDEWGLAQINQLKAQLHPLAWLYPAGVFRTIRQEHAAIYPNGPRLTIMRFRIQPDL